MTEKQSLRKQIEDLSQRLAALQAKSEQQAIEISLLRAQVAALQAKPDPFRPIGPEPWRWPERDTPLIPRPPIYVAPNTSPPNRVIIHCDSTSNTADTARSDERPSA